MVLTITIGPDTQSGGGGTAWAVRTEDGEIYDTDGSRGLPRGESTARWLRYARRHVRFGRGHRPQWTRATVRPAGWSLGADHAPHGVVITLDVGGVR